MKRIGLTQRVVENATYRERRDALDQRWTVLAEAAGFLPVPIPNRAGDPGAFVAALGLDGAILTGGNDLQDYGGDAPERDALERALLERALREDFPVLGVCRGLQMIQHFMGGRLERIEGHVGEATGIVWNGAPRVVNSFHGFGIRAAAPELVVLATAADGTIEAARHASRPIVGIMWHPERCDPFDDSDIKLVRDMWRIS